MAEKLVDVPTSAPQKGKDELAGVKLQTLKPTEVDGAPAKPPTADEPLAVPPEKQQEDIEQALAEPRDKAADKAIADGLEALASSGPKA